MWVRGIAVVRMRWWGSVEASAPSPAWGSGVAGAGADLWSAGIPARMGGVVGPGSAGALSGMGQWCGGGRCRFVVRGHPCPQGWGNGVL